MSGTLGSALREMRKPAEATAEVTRGCVLSPPLRRRVRG